MKKFALFLIAFCLIFPQAALAVSITINSVPSSVSSDPFNVDVSVLGASAGQNYLRVDLFKDGTSNYFGETYNGSSWYKGSDGTQYFPLSIADSKTTASATLQVRLGVPTSGEYPGPGSYKLKIRRYTSSGNAASSDDQSPVDLTINYSVPSSPTPTPKTASTSTGSSTSVSKTSTAKVSTPTPIKSPTAVSHSTTTHTSQSTADSGKITSDNSKIVSDFARIQNPTPTTERKSEVSVLGESKKEFPWMFITLLGGLILLVFGVGLYAKNNWEKIKIWMENL